MATFSQQFDHTFTGTPISVPVAYPPPNNCGITLMWLSGLSWRFWTFEGFRTTGLSTSDVGSFRRRGLNLRTQKQSEVGYLLRTATLTEPEAEHVASLIQSVAVYWLQYDATTTMQPVEVTVEVDSLTVSKQSSRYSEIEIPIALPQTDSLRR